jgi:RimJ/RimL family protein N-acetyltransferase
MFEIKSERLTLRKLEPVDAPLIFAYRSLPEVRQFQCWGESQEEIETYVCSLEEIAPGMPGAWFQLGIVREADKRLIGDCGFRVLASEPQQAEIGIALSPTHQSQGYATEAVRVLLEYIFVTLGKHRVIGSVDPRNVKSIQLMQRVGMRQEAHFIKSLWFKGEWVDDLVFAMLDVEWQSGRRGDAV